MDPEKGGIKKVDGQATPGEDATAGKKVQQNHDLLRIQRQHLAMLGYISRIKMLLLILSEVTLILTSVIVVYFPTPTPRSTFPSSSLFEDPSVVVIGLNGSTQFNYQNLPREAVFFLVAVSSFITALISFASDIRKCKSCWIKYLEVLLHYSVGILLMIVAVAYIMTIENDVELLLGKEVLASLGLIQAMFHGIAGFHILVK